MPNHPIQQSLDPNLAPDVELDQIELTSATERWMNNASQGPMIHRFVGHRANNRMLAGCGLVGRKCPARKVPAYCPDCFPR